MKEEEEQEQVDAAVEILEEAIESSRPISSQFAVDARADCIREHRRQMISENNNSHRASPASTNSPNANSLPPASYSSIVSSPPVIHQYENQQLHNPNLDVPTSDGEAYVSLAQ